METKETKPAENKVEVKKEISPFIEEGSTFEVEIKYYLEEKQGGMGRFVVKNVHDDFDVSKECSSFKVTLRIPTQKDALIMNGRQNKNVKGESEFDVYKTFSEVEYARFLLLVKDWTLSNPCTEESIHKLHPSFVKGIVAAIRNEIGMDSIV